MSYTIMLTERECWKDIHEYLLVPIGTSYPAPKVTEIITSFRTVFTDYILPDGTEYYRVFMINKDAIAYDPSIDNDAAIAHYVNNHQVKTIPIHLKDLAHFCNVHRLQLASPKGSCPHLGADLYDEIVDTANYILKMFALLPDKSYWLTQAKELFQPFLSDSREEVSQTAYYYLDDLTWEVTLS